ncbi:MAG: hypothetical protein ACRD0H_31630 [Actinomycetes bacterium]
MPSHQPGAQRLRSVEESRSPADPGSDFDSTPDWPGSPHLSLVDQERDAADQRYHPAEPQDPQPGTPTTTGDADRRASGRRLVGPPDRRRWGRGTRPPEDEPGEIPRREDGFRQDDD